MYACIYVCIYVCINESKRRRGLVILPYFYAPGVEVNLCVHAYVYVCMYERIEAVRARYSAAFMRLVSR
jgi:hypothetical protein